LLATLSVSAPQIDTFLARYPETLQEEENSSSSSMKENRFLLWKWSASFLMTACMILPILSLATQTVKERQFKMKDLLQISGLLDISYWCSYLLASFIMLLVCMIFFLGLLWAGTVLTRFHIFPYFILLMAYALAFMGFLMLFGFAVFRTEYYGLPAFLVSVGLTVGGVYIAHDKNLTIGSKVFLGLLIPQFGVSNAIFAVETWLYHHSDESMDWSHVDNDKNLPSLITSVMFLLLSTIMYLFLLWGMPFDWVFQKENAFENVRPDDDIVYPCDDEDDVDNVLEEVSLHNDDPFAEPRDTGDSRKATDSIGTMQSGRPPTPPLQQQGGREDALLRVNDLHHIYPDGTAAVKGMSFQVKSGEILSFLGANGAGELNCFMYMLPFLFLHFSRAHIQPIILATLSLFL
jgi:hypothetical protein